MKTYKAPVFAKCSEGITASGESFVSCSNPSYYDVDISGLPTEIFSETSRKVTITFLTASILEKDTEYKITISNIRIPREDIAENNVDISTYKEHFYILNGDLGVLTTLNVEKMEVSSYSMTEPDNQFNNGGLGNDQIIFICNHLYSRLNPEKSVQNKTKDLLFENTVINYFVANTRTYQASIFKSFLMSDFVDLKSKVKLVLFKENKSRNEFIIPIIIVLVILILNTFYKSYKKGKDIIIQKLYSFEEGVLTFKNKEIALDENSKMILELLSSNDQVSSNDVVALLVENGMSMDYASKIKNKTIERLNEKFEFITGSTENFIQTLKSKEDKRIQVIQLIKE